MATLTAQPTGKDLFMAEIARLAGDGGNGWRAALRSRGHEAFNRLGFPTQRDEAWRQTSLSGFIATPFQNSAAAPVEIVEATLAALRYPGLSGPEAVFINGRLTKLAGLEALPAGVRVLDLTSAAIGNHDSIQAHLGAYADLENNAFTALNAAFLDQGLAIIVPRGVILEQPIHIIFNSTDEAFHAHPRLLVLAGENSQCTIVESWGAASDEAVYFNNPVAEIAAGENAVVHHIKVQRESRAAFHIATTQYHQARGSQVHSHSLVLGGALVRNDLGAVLDGENAHCTLNGLYITSGTQHVDNHTRLDHAMPHCTSHEAYKGILDDQSSGVFTGRILVRPDAQKTDAIQRNRALLLTPTATVNSQPQLEIFADDVRCTHGATVGQLDEDALFYLRARGIPREAAQGLLTYAFANEIVEQLPIAPVRARLEHELAVHFNIIAEGAGQ